MNKDSLGAIILAAGEGKRFGATDKSKVTELIGGVPMITRTINNLREFEVKTIVVVVGFAKESVLALLDSSIIAVEQKERLGTANAVQTGLDALPSFVEDVLILHGDDSYLYTKDIFSEMYALHKKNGSEITLATKKLEDPFGIGRIIRNEAGEIVKIREEKDATPEEKNISEVNLGFYIFSVEFLKDALTKISASDATGEYYLTSLVEIASKSGKISSFELKNIAWRGVNTKEELQEAQKLVQ